MLSSIRIVTIIVMSDSWLDMLPSSERQKVREKYKMSAAAYEQWREKVRERGPEYIEKEQMWNEAMAQLKFGMETEPHMKEALKQQIEKDITEQGLEAVLKNPDLPAELKQQLEAGQFDIIIDAPTEDEPDQLVLVPEGNVSEKCGLTTSLSESYLSQMQGGK